MLHINSESLDLLDITVFSYANPLVDRTRTYAFISYAFFSHCVINFTFN